ncbi:hypothetical protein T439DRAFT_325853 [Meredithblackwellia eburnea MCA 4105]
MSKFLEKPLDEVLKNAAPLDFPLRLSEADYEFLTTATGIKDVPALHAHMRDFQKEAYETVWPFPCIRFWAFARLKASTQRLYKDVVKRGKEEKDAYFLDLGSCFGTDVRKAVIDGYPSELVIGVELMKGFVDISTKLFPAVPSPQVYVGDIFDTKTFSDPDAPSILPADLSTLTPIKGKVRAVHCGSFFHLFSEEKQKEIVVLLKEIVSLKEGTTIFGTHIGNKVAGLRESGMYCHDPETWKTLWNEVFGADKIEVKTCLRPSQNFQHMIVWSVLIQ